MEGKRREWMVVRGDGAIVGACAVAAFISALALVDFEAGGASAASGAASVLLALPSFASFLRWAGEPRGVAVLGAIGALTVMVEAVAVVTGFPYGSFSYSERLGPLVLGLVPWSLPFSYLPILLGAAYLSERLAGTSLLRFVFTSSAILVSVDLALDPGAVAAGLWVWDSGSPTVPSWLGAYYGIPPENYLGWGLTGLAYSSLLYALVERRRVVRGGMPPGTSSSFVLILAFWTGFLVRAGYTVPASVGALALFATYSAAYLPGAADGAKPVIGLGFEGAGD